MQMIWYYPITLPKKKCMQITYILIPTALTTPLNTALPTLPLWISLLMQKDTKQHYIKVNITR